jgi:uncharacterized protein
MRVVLDTNVLVSGIFFHGIPGKILDAWVNDQFELSASPLILDEYARVIFELAGEKEDLLAMEWISNLFGLSHVVPEPSANTSHCRDPKDDKFIHCALSSRAKYLVSGDKDILSLTQNFPFRVIPPQKFLAHL